MVLRLWRRRGEWPGLGRDINFKYFQCLICREASVSTLDPFETRRDPALKQRPAEAERQRQIAAFDHPIGLFRSARHPAGPTTPLQDASLAARHSPRRCGVI